MPVTITIDDARLIAEQLADVFEERGLVTTGKPERFLDVPAVAELLGCSTDWVYEHARELGGFRMGDPQPESRAPIRFRRAEIDEYARARSLRPNSPEGPRAHRRRGRAARPTADTPLIDYEEQP